MRTPPPFLYKYFSGQVSTWLTDPQLRFSNPDTFNDPFEFRPLIRFRATPIQAREILALNHISEKLPLEEQEEELARIAHSLAGQQYKVLCLTEDPLHPLMWGHYANHHRGCVLAFDSDLLIPFHKLGMAAGPVEYSASRPIITFPPPDADAQLETLRVALTKGKDWAYEKEWRLALLHRKSERNPSTEFNFYPELLRFVILGARCEKAERQAIRAALKANPKLKHVEYVQAKIAKNGFGLELERRDGSRFDLDHFVREFERKRHIRRDRGKVWYAEPLRKRAEKEAELARTKGTPQTSAPNSE